MSIAPYPSNVRRVQALFSLAALFALAVPAALAQSASASSQTTLQIQAPLVLEDVVVLDGHNQPVHNLKASDFTVTDDGKPVTPRNFDEHSAAKPSPPAPAPAAAAAPLPPGTFTNRNAIPAGVPLNVVVLDALNTPLTDQVHVRLQMIKFLSTVAPGTPVAVYGLSNHLYLLQGFTTNPALLAAVMKAAGSGGKGDIRLTQASTGGPGIDQESLDSLGLITGGAASGDTAGVATMLSYQAFQMQMQAIQDVQKAEVTLRAFEDLARDLSILPGRKNLIWLSGSFPLSFIPTAAQTYMGIMSSTGSGDANTAASGMATSAQASLAPLVRNTDDLLRRSQIAIYPIDAYGLETDQSTSASSNAHLGDSLTTQQLASLAGGTSPNQAAGGSPESIGYGPGTGSASRAADNVTNLADKIDDEHATMNQMADDTGGKAYFNSDDFAAAARSAMDLGANYYTISYTPSGGKWDGKSHKVEIKVDQPGLHLSYRRRYFADAPDDSHSQPAPHAGPMQAAMMHGAPEADGLVFDVSATVADNPSGQLARGSKPDPKLMQPPYKTCTLIARLDLHTLQMTPDANGDQTGNIEFVMLVYDANGNLVNQSAVGGHLVLPPERYQQVLQSGLVIKPAIDVPARGIYFIRVGFHDPASDRVGAVEFPVSALPPPAAVAQASPPQ